MCFSIRQQFFWAVACLLIFSSFCGNAQRLTGKAIYSVKLAEDMFHFDATLEFTEKSSFYRLKQNERKKWMINRDFKTQIVFTDSAGHAIYRNYAEPILWVRDFCDRGKGFIYIDSAEFNWQIGNEEILIQGVLCRNAITTFRGRDYEAWFAPSIPVNAGPWKFHNLPGLIFEITDNSQEVSIIIKSLKTDFKSQEITWQFTDSKISLQEFYDCQHQQWIENESRDRAIIASLQAEYPTIEISLDQSDTRPMTELEF